MTYDFIKRRKLWYALSLFIIIPGLISIALQGLNLGIDFTGGNIFRLQFEQNVSSTELREVMGRSEVTNYAIQEAGAKQFIIRTSELPEEESTKFLAHLEKNLGELELLGVDKVGAIIGHELTYKAILSLIIASIFMVGYITLRFEFLSGVAAIIALLHDVLVTVSIFSLLQIEINASFIAAILTVIGYSINDTIVIFDRIRENLRIAKKADLLAIVNASLNQILIRSINTSVAVILILLALVFLGGETIRVFAVAMLIGAVAGTYSSICTASILWVDLKGILKKRKATAHRTA
ncbi:MAG: protein translocase subunit SecF [Syntrophomonadaceae bacterium]|nr:protein translocase subunit SecF [Syntrophomonadaceae bacterium]